MSNFTYSDELYHHGVLGMKWGVRRYQNSDGSLTAAGKKRYNLKNKYRKHLGKTVGMGIAAEAGAFMVPVAAGAGLLAGASTGTSLGATFGMYSGAAIGTTAYLKMYDVMNKKYNELQKTGGRIGKEKTYIETGTNFVRTTLKSKESNDAMYMTYAKDKRTRDYYEKVWPDYLRRISGSPKAKVYQNTYSVKTDLVAPSIEERQKAAHAVLTANKKMAEEFAKSNAMDQVRLVTGYLKAKNLSDVKKHYSGYPEYVKDIQKMYKYVEKASAKVNVKEDYKDFKKFTATLPTNSKLMKKYIDELKKQGFDCMFDDNSNSTGAFVVFDSKSLNQVDSKVLN